MSDLWVDQRNVLVTQVVGIIVWDYTFDLAFKHPSNVVKNSLAFVKYFSDSLNRILTRLIESC